jgi:hypothetical protein
MIRRFAKAVFDALPRSIRRPLKDRLEDMRRRRPGAHRGIEKLGLTAAQVYPVGNNFDECLLAGVAPQLAGLVITKETPVASIGSCFADEFAKHMRSNGFNYLAVESDVFSASANWGRVFTTAGLQQIVRYSTTDDVPVLVERSPDGWFDPLREPAVGHFRNREEAERAIRAHRAASRRVFATARVLILTLGQNEAWVDRRSGFVWAHRPPSSILTADVTRFEPREFSFEENVSWIEESLHRLRDLNPALDILLTVSPIASYATFAGPDAVTHSFAGKSILRAAADRITRTVPRVWYFPSFEMALAFNPHTQNADNRHVKNATVDRIFKLLERTVVR